MCRLKIYASIRKFDFCAMPRCTKNYAVAERKRQEKEEEEMKGLEDQKRDEQEKKIKNGPFVNLMKSKLPIQFYLLMLCRSSVSSTEELQNAILRLLRVGKVRSMLNKNGNSQTRCAVYILFDSRFVVVVVVVFSSFGGAQHVYIVIHALCLFVFDFLLCA